MVDDELKSLFDVMRQENVAAQTETRRYVSAVESRIESTAGGLREHFDSTASDMRRHFDVVSEGLRHEIRLVAEKVTLVDERLTREAADIREEMRRGFAETRP